MVSDIRIEQLNVGDTEIYGSWYDTKDCFKDALYHIIGNKSTKIDDVSCLYSRSLKCNAFSMEKRIYIFIEDGYALNDLLDKGCSPFVNRCRKVATMWFDPICIKYERTMNSLIIHY